MSAKELNICVVRPSHIEADRAFFRLVSLLRAADSEFNVVIAGSITSEHSAAVNTHAEHSLEDILLQESRGSSVIDLFVCWELPVISRILTGAPRRPIVNGLTWIEIFQGRLPVHRSVVGYLSDSNIFRELLCHCGIPPARQITLTLTPEEAACELRQSFPAEPRSGVLVIGEDPRFIEAVKSACGLLGMRLDRLSMAMGRMAPADTLNKYEIVVAAGHTALRAVAAGATVILADAQGIGGVIRENNLAAIIEAEAGPSCYSGRISNEALVLALTEARVDRKENLAQDIYRRFGQANQAKQLNDWLRSIISLAHEVKKGEAIATWPNLLNIPAMAALPKISSMPASSDAYQLKPESLLVETAPVRYSAPPRLPLDQEIKATDAILDSGFFVDGWSTPESWGRWSYGNEATISFKTDEYACDLLLLINAHPYLPAGLRYQRVLVKVNGRSILSWKVSDDEAYPVALPINSLNREFVWQISFYLPDSDSPFSWGDGDQRRLAIGIKALVLSKAEASCQETFSRKCHPQI
jgi:hypothetical protein